MRAEDPTVASVGGRRRAYAADDVFAALAREILRGELRPGDALPPERVLSERFGVSKLLVRQAIHRLAAADLVRVRQGDVTRVLDASRSCSLDVIELYYRLAPESEGAREVARHVLEKQYTQGLSLLEVFSRRAPRAFRVQLAGLPERAEAAACASEEAFAAFEERFWTLVARGGGNRILEAEVAFWYRALRARPRMPKTPPRDARFAFYRELARRIEKGDAPLEYYVAALSPAVTALFPEPRDGNEGCAR
jgi:DNA-binding FadR family transcriptional regulator